MNLNNDAASQMLIEQPERPETLKILCILSFVGCGMMLLAYSIGTMFLSIGADTIATFWDKIVETNPQLADTDPNVFFHEVGIVSLYALIATVFSLVGVVMMWRMERMGFFIYAVAELATNFFGMSSNITNQEKSYGSTGFMIFLDLIFIILYFTQLKHMAKKPSHTGETGL